MQLNVKYIEGRNRFNFRLICGENSVAKKAYKI